METYFELDKVSPCKSSVLTIGNFDGIHRGHQKIINRTVNIAKGKAIPSIIVTFHPHPKHILNHDKSKLSIILDLKNKLKMFDELGVDITLIINFTDDFSKINALEFLKNIIVNKFNPDDLVLGYDHHFGHKRTGSPDMVREFGKNEGINVEIVNAVSDNDSIISSTQIRNHINSGYIRRANFELGWVYGFNTNVVKGAGRGHSLSFPTANFVPRDLNQLLPKDGVYLARGRVAGKQLYGMCNLGVRPTFNEGNFVMEVHFFDCHDVDLYSKNIRIEFLERVRDEIKFVSIDDLVSQLTQDKNHCLGLLKKYY